MNPGPTSIARRLGRALSVLVAVYAITFAFIRLTPGNPFANRAPRALSEQAQRQIEAQFSLDDPWYVQFMRYPARALTGDLGVSYNHQGQSVTAVIGERLGPTASLLVAAILIGLLVGVPIGIFTALRQNSWLDHVVSALTTAGVAVPVFVVTPVLIVVFAVYLGALPPQGWDGLFTTTAIIPVIALALEPIAIVARFTRSSMIEVMRSDHIRTARARGLRHSTVVYRHGLKNGATPIATVTGLEVAALTGSVLFVEQAYNVPGLGSEFLAAITARDYPVILALTLLLSIVIVAANLAVDVSYGHLDPADGGTRMTAVVTEVVATAPGRTRESAGARNRFCANSMAIVSLAMLVALAVAALSSDLYMSRGYADQSLATANQPPLSGHGLLGTDQLGRDLLTRVLFGIRLSLAAAFVAVVVELIIGVTLGLIAGHRGGRTDAAIMRTVDVLLALPGLLIALVIGLSIKEQILTGTGWFAGALRAIDDATAGMVPVFTVIVLFFWVSIARIVRGEVRRIEQLDYVAAAKVIGASPSRILRRHVLRNCTGPIIVACTLAIPLAMVLEASLSLVGVGVAAPTPSLGLMIFEGTQQINSFPYQALVPAVVFALITVAFMFVGNGLRDAFDPTESGGR